MDLMLKKAILFAKNTLCNDYQSSKYTGKWTTYKQQILKIQCTNTNLASQDVFWIAFHKVLKEIYKNQYIKD